MKATIFISSIFIVVACFVFVSARNVIFRNCEESNVHRFEWPSLDEDTKTLLLERIALSNHGLSSHKLHAHEIPKAVKKHYLTEELLKKVQHLVGHKVMFADKQDPNRIFVKLYTDEKDGIFWHYDPNFTRGSRYTLVFLLYKDPCSTSSLQIKDCVTDRVYTIDESLEKGSGVLFDASKIYHRVTPQRFRGCRRLSVVIPLYEDYSFDLTGRLLFNLHLAGNKILRV